MKLIIAWLFIGVIIFTTFLTCLSLVVPEVFVVKAQQRWLFRVLIAELIIGAVAMFFGFINPSTKAASKEIVRPAEEENKKLSSNISVLLMQKDRAMRENLAAQMALYDFQTNSKEPITVQQNVDRQKAIDDLRRRIELLKKQLAEEERRNSIPLLQR